MKVLAAVDPGVSVAGWAIFEGDRLTMCGLAMGNTWYQTARDLPDIHADILVVEHPVAYPRSAVNPNNLIKLGIMAGAAAMSFDAAEVLAPTPREWKGQTPKEIHNRRVLLKLTPIEKAIHGQVKVPQYLVHNMTDAVGLGLWALNRR